MNNEYNDYNKDDEYTPRHANDFYQNSSNDLIIDNNLNYINTNDDFFEFMSYKFESSIGDYEDRCYDKYKDETCVTNCLVTSHLFTH